MRLKPCLIIGLNFSLSEARSTAFSISVKIIGDRSIRVIEQPSVAKTKASPASPAVASRTLGVLPDFKPTAFAIAWPRPPPNSWRCARLPFMKSTEIVVSNWRSYNSIKSSWKISCNLCWSSFFLSNGSVCKWQKSLACCRRYLEWQTTAMGDLLEILDYLR